MKRSRLIYGILTIVFLVLTLALPGRALLSAGNPAADAAARGDIVFNSNDYNSGAKSADYILLCLFAALTLVFAFRTLKPPTRKNS